MRPDVQQFLAYVATLDITATQDQDPPAARRSMIDVVAATDLPLGELATSKDLAIPGPGGPIPARLFDRRISRAPGPVVLWLHGGGFVTGGIESHQSLCAEAARQLDLPVVLIDYRKGPEHPFPAAPEDAEAAARWLAGNPEFTGLVLAGDSAGGTLTIATCQALRDRPAAVPVLAQLVIYPATDETRKYPSEEEFADGLLLTMASRKWFRAHYQPVPTDVRASPLLGELAGLPPAVVVTAGMDIVRDEGRAYAAGLVSAGVPTIFQEAAGNIHVFVLLRKVIPSSQDDVSKALRALKELVEAN